MFSDEMYRGLEYSTSSQLPSAFLASDNAVTLSGLSKAFALPGLRIGWLCTKDAELLARINELKDYTTICPATPSSLLAEMALEDRDHILERSRSIIADGPIAYPSLLPAPGSPCSPTRAVCSQEYCNRLEDAANLMVIPSKIFEDGVHAPSSSSSSTDANFRVSFGRKNTAALFAAWDDAIANGLVY
eukprot:gene8521-11681_t